MKTNKIANITLSNVVTQDGKKPSTTVARAAKLRATPVKPLIEPIAFSNAFCCSSPPTLLLIIEFNHCVFS